MRQLPQGKPYESLDSIRRKIVEAKQAIDDRDELLDWIVKQSLRLEKAGDTLGSIEYLQARFGEYMMSGGSHE
jgi:hypothetical protein